MLAIIQEGASVGYRILENLELNFTDVKTEIESLIATEPKRYQPEFLSFTPGVEKIIETASEYATELGHNYLGSEHLVFGMIRHDCFPGRILGRCGIREERYRSSHQDLTRDF